MKHHLNSFDTSHSNTFFNNVADASPSPTLMDFLVGVGI